MKAVNPILEDNINWLTENGKPQNIFVPLCGKTVDLKYLVDLGHTVFGTEWVYECIEALAEENGFQFIFDEKNSVYYTADLKLKIYKGNFHECPIEDFGPFDAIWDRGAFVAVEYYERRNYIEFMKRSVRTSNGGKNTTRN